MIKLLPRWVCSNRSASFYDVESVNIMEAAAQMQGKMNELIEDYNKFVDETNKTITEFITKTNDEQECFKQALTELVENYIKTIDLKIDNQDLKIDNFVNGGGE